MSDLKQQLREEITLFCQQHPDIEEVDLICAGMTPNLWGKRYPISKLTKLINELKMPRGNFLMSPVGEYIPVMHYNDTDGDPDASFQFIPGTLKTVPWQSKRAQIMFSSADATQPFDGEPRVVLSKVLKQLAAQNRFPTVAFELEFYLIDKTRTEDGLLQVPKNPINGRDDICAVLSMDRLDVFAELLTDIRQSCEEQGISSTAISAEIGAGQFEINLNHRSDCLQAADEVIQYQRLIKGVAVKHGFEATFMAKPYLQDAGNGMHLHISMYDGEGNNEFAKNEQQTLMQAVAGCLDTMHGAFPFIASNPNAYRRYVPDLAIATQKSWAHENRYVAVRIPASDEKNLRIEHRVPAADANPYLVLAAILAGIQWGIENKLQPGEPFEGLACYEHLYPHTLEEALNKLEQSEAMRSVLGSHFVDIYLAYKRSEVKEFNNYIAAREYAWYA
ncbi:MAG: glutamine synthetase [Bermanella sp.]|nr:glutamine synthetase [Bermanella sp.]|tara:strand:+ start:1733 stop:3073 length:1341 start_codon:yes stop_codon:yes gene_type:complete